MTAPAIPQGWTLGPDGLRRTWKFANFREALAFVVEVGRLAESVDHHPDIDIRWNTVVLTLITHSSGGVTENDYGVAGKINRLDPAAAVKDRLPRLF
jgi:4a-hydroxytetrahydrobiopterin dehydratase